MNCTELFLKHARSRPDAMALCLLSNSGADRLSYGELLALAARAQALCRSRGVRPGDSVLLLDTLSFRLYASIIGLLSMGASVVLVEPWMPVAKIERVIRLVRPKLFLSSAFGYLWGSRVRAIREIPRWARTSMIRKTFPAAGLHLEDVGPGARGIITFTSGTTGEPKGVVRDQDYLIRQNEVLARNLEQDKHTGSDLCIFANFALMNLASGRGSVIVPPSWDARALRMIDELPQDLQPETLTAGPAFLIQLMKHARLPKLKSAHVGGAQTDCAIFEKAFAKWPEAHFSHVYGGSEVEPVALIDAAASVRESRKRGYFQALYLGGPVSEIQAQVSTEGLWVAGPHVCPEYLGNAKETAAFKRKDETGTLWHSMGDRVKSDELGWWYFGRSGQPEADFALEQKVYGFLQSSKSFVHIKHGGERWLVGEDVKKREAEILAAFPELAGVAEAKIHRDRRHRARLDRAKTVQKGARWLVR